MPQPRPIPGACAGGRMASGARFCGSGRGRRGAATGLACLVLLTGCSHATATPTSRSSSASVASASPTVASSTSSLVTASGGVSSPASVMPLPGADLAPVHLSTYGFKNGPSAFVLPPGLVVIETIDQPNVVTLVLAPDQGAGLAAWLVKSLPGQGYRIEGSSADSVVFDDDAWQGAFTSSEQLCGLTLRKQS